MTQNAINNTASTLTVGTSTTNNNISVVRSAEGQWLDMDDQTDTFGVYNSTGTPEGGVAANIGSICTDTTNGALYIKTTDTANTGWVLISGFSGQTVQEVTATNAAFQTTVVAIPADDSIPQITEGAEHLTVTITPTNASNILNIWYTAQTGTTNSLNYTHALFQDATVNALYAGGYNEGHVAPRHRGICGQYSMVAGTTSSTTFRLRFGGNNGVAAQMNGLGAGRVYGGVSLTSLVVEEVLP